MKPKNLRSWIKQITFSKVDRYNTLGKTIITIRLPSNVILLQKHGLKTVKKMLLTNASQLKMIIETSFICLCFKICNIKVNLSQQNYLNFNQ